DDWTFFGRASQSVALVVNTGSGGVPTPLQPSLNWAQVTLLDPNGIVVATTSNATAGADASLLRVALPSDGIYHIQVQAEPGHTSSVGSYALGAYDATIHTMTTNLNQTTTGQISTSYSQDLWTFSALSSQQIRFDLVAAANPSIKFDLTGPN